MKTLLIYDASDIPSEREISFVKAEDVIFLFPLTSNKDTAEAFVKVFKGRAMRTELLQTAEMLNASAQAVRNKYLRFISELPRQVVYRGKNLRQLFAIDSHTSAWWFSLLSEKNTFKSDSFNRLAQLDSIISFVKSAGIKRVVCLCRNKKLRGALGIYAAENSLDLKEMAAKGAGSFKTEILKLHKLRLCVRHNLLMLKFAAGLFFKFLRIKSSIGVSRRISQIHGTDLILITPYPNLEMSEARRGIFKNRFYPHLQERLEAEGWRTVWIAMLVKSNILSFEKSVKLAKQFIRNGHKIIFIDEFNSVIALIRALLIMLQNEIKFFKIEKELFKAHSFGDYNFYPIFEEDWYLSFAGTAGYEGMVCYEMFKRMFKTIYAKKCLYLCEMHAWEKALISARGYTQCGTLLYAYQSGTVSKMLLNYFNTPSELKEKGPFSIPVPDRLICNGRLPYDYMKESGWPEERLFLAEAIRYFYLKRDMGIPANTKRDEVLVALSISPSESSSIINVVQEAFRDFKDIKVSVRPHPFLRLEETFEMSGIPRHTQTLPFKISNIGIEKLFNNARIVIAGQSGVSIEALAHGCYVIIVNISDWINMSPLLDIHSKMVRVVNSAEGLRAAVLDILKEADNYKECEAEIKAILNRHFCLDSYSDTPHRFLHLLRE